jgi:hypothetical protein
MAGLREQNGKYEVFRRLGPEIGNLVDSSDFSAAHLLWPSLAMLFPRVWTFPAYLWNSFHYRAQKHKFISIAQKSPSALC